MTKEELKKEAGERAVNFIQSGMIVGLGTGRTAYYAVKKIGELINSGVLKDIKAIPTSKRTEELAAEFGIPMTTLADNPVIDVTIDGADEVDEDLNLIKGGGGALLREKVIAQASKMFVVVVDDSKLSNRLGEKWAVPVEVIPFAKEVVEIYLKSLGGDVKLRIKNEDDIFITDEGNVILDTNFGFIDDYIGLDKKLKCRAGIVEHGIFIGLTNEIVVAKNDKTEFGQ